MQQDLIAQDSHELNRLKRLFYSRFIGSFVLLILFNWLTGYSSIEQSIPLSQIFFLWLILSTLQLVMFRFPHVVVWNLLLQLTSDFILIGLLIYISGGISSPFIFLLGVVIIIAGTQARVLVVLTSAILASITYLLVIYTYASSHNHSVSNESTLQILLQISLFFLAGGIMAIIARRHANLQQEQRFTTQKHRQLQDLHSHVLSSMQEGIIILDDTLIVQDFNAASSHILGIPPQQAGHYLQDFLQIPDDMLDFISHNDLDVFRTEIRHRGQCLLITLTRLNKENTSWLMTIVNITETRELERQLAEQDKLASIGQMASMLAHEIRNPMQTISQAVELMGLQMKENKLEHIITDEISRLNRLVSDILDYASPLHPHIQHVQIQTLIQNSIEQIDLKNKYQIQVTCPELNINIDPDHFRLVADNLIRNAIHASPTPQSVHITFSHKNKDWVFTVRDHGKGISDKMRKTLFEPFRTGKKTGTGLGLATVWQVCQVNQWSIHVDETIHDGISFVVTCQHPNNTSGEDHG